MKRLVEIGENDMTDVKTVSLNFDFVHCGQKSVKSVKFHNESKKVKTYVVIPCKGKISNTGCERLKFSTKEAVVLPGKYINFTLTYLSYLENTTDNIFYEVLDCDKFVAKLCVHAQSMGPKLSPNCLNVNFYRFRDVCDMEKHVEIVNTAKCEAKYHFDMDEYNEIIQISKPNGLIPAGGKINIKVTFRPRECGIYYKQIFCLVQFHKPIILNVLGIYNPKLGVNPKKFVYKYPFHPCFVNTHQIYVGSLESREITGERPTLMQKCTREYLNESTTDSEEIDEEVPVPPKIHPIVYPKDEIILTNHFVDMKTSAEMLQATTLINLSETREYYFRWSHDVRKNFQIKPSRGVLKPEKKIEFSIIFNTSVPDQLFYGNLDLRVFPCEEEEDEKLADRTVQLPLTFNFRIIGNSFASDSCGWVPQCTIVPKVLQLPTCTPGQTVYATFIIERRGHLPVTYQILLPQFSKYSVQPRLGCITGDFQVFVVEFNGNETKGIFKEHLKVLYNDSPTECDCIQLKTFVEVLELVFGNDNSYTFPCTFPKSKTVADIPVENPTNLYLRYEFIVPDDISWLEISNPKGQVEPMSTFKLEAVFKPEVPCEYLDYIQCNISLLSDGPEVQPEVMQYQVIGSCQFGYLVATPNMHDFGECIYGEEKNIKIHVYNFSPVVLNYRLRTVHRAFPVGNTDLDVRVNPSNGVINGKSSAEIDITVSPHGKDIFQYALICDILDNNSGDAQPCEESKKIFLFRFEGVLPSLRILDLNIENGGPLFSPHLMWKMMKIDCLNKAFESPAPEQRLDIKFPEAMVGSPLIKIKLLVEAKRFGEVVWEIVKKVKCPCKDAISESNSNSSKKDCLHVKAISWTPTKVKLKPKERIVMEVTLEYQHEGEFNVEWIMNMPFNRKLIVASTLISLPEDEPSFTSMYMDVLFEVKPIFLGDLDPPIQLFWLYNNTHHTSSFVIEKLPQRDTTAFSSNVFDCIHSNGVIPPFSCAPIKFLFKPNEIISYTAEFLLCIRENIITKITLKGDGVSVSERIKELSIDPSIPEKSILTNPNIGLQCSVNIINILYLPVFSETKKLFFLSNTSKDDSWAFNWHDFQIENIIYTKVMPREGVLKPGEILSMTLLVKSKCYSSFVNISIPCDIINYTALKKYKSALKSQQGLDEASKDYFTITEKGITYDRPNMEIPDEPSAKHIFITLNINIISRVNSDQKLLIPQQVTLNSSKEKIPEPNPTVPEMAQYMLPCMQNTLEKVLWNILVSELFKHQIKVQQKSLDYNYQQIEPKTDRQSVEIFQKMSYVLNRHEIQNHLENIIKNILFKNLLTNTSDVDPK